MEEVKCKKCNKCGEIKTLDCFCRKKDIKSGISGTCKECGRLHTKLWILKNPEKKKEMDKMYVQKNKEKIIEYRNKYYQENKERISKRNKEYCKENRELVLYRLKLKTKRHVENLTDTYIRTCLIQKNGFTKDIITPELIQAKREIIKIKRLCKQQQQEQKLQTS